MRKSRKRLKVGKTIHTYGVDILTLHEKKCIPCEGGIPAFKIDEINEYLKKVDGWSVKEDEKDKFYLIKEFKFKNFVSSQELSLIHISEPTRP